ncbi:ATP-grasp domain-containing protein [Streptantibioticus ferralitis]|uniref:Glutathione synthase n=1 Tax=Streptantibioticus ferralitis TaxID=236510 RepID=A0ABT5YYB9_9ACTN|nr:glutathione synthase [Streptantibioticus ferralitis]MDF2256594.1 glutathione synthase [Streptantibioticus ferralitis]
MSYKILVLVSEAATFRLDNHSIIPSALHREGHEVYIGDIDTLCVHDSVVVCDRVKLTEEYLVGSDFPALSETYASAEEFDLVWVLAGTHPDALTDHFQLLWLLNRRVPFVNEASALFYMNSKTTLGAAVPNENLPASYVSNDFDFLTSLVESDSERTWVVKPTNDGIGADVYFLSKNERNRSALLQSATGNAAPRYGRYGRDIIGMAKRYTAVQEYIPNVRSNEKRVIIAGDVPVSGFRRFHPDHDDRANVTLGARFEALTLTPEEDDFVRRLGKRMMELGIFYSGIDLAYPYVMEFNLVNPGGLSYAYRATGVDRSSEAVNTVLAALRASGKLS